MVDWAQSPNKLISLLLLLLFKAVSGKRANGLNVSGFVPHSSRKSGFCTMAAVHYRSSRPPCTTVVQTAVYQRSSRLSCTVQQVAQTAVYYRSSRRLCTTGHPDCRVLQVIQTVEKLPRHRSLQRLELTPEIMSCREHACN